MWLTFTMRAAGELQAASPIEFFTNVAPRMLATLGANLEHIPVYPTNAYTPSIHRLLQVTANLYDSTTTNWYPTLFRPTFGTDGTSIFISGYEEVCATNEAFLTMPLDPAEANTGAVIATNGRVNIYGIPWIIGVKKGLPNFNELGISSDFSVSRQLLVEKPTTVSPPGTFQFRQRLIMSLANEIGAEMWNSYANDFPTGLEVLADCRIRTVLTNRLGGAWTNTWNIAETVSVPMWPGRGFPASPLPSSFLIPLRTNCVLLRNAVFNSATGAFNSTNTAPFDPVLTPAAQWGLHVQTFPRLIIREASTQRVFDYVHFRGLDFFRRLDDEVRTSGYGANGLWNTNLTKYAPFVQEGVQNQLRISMGDPGVPISDWNNYGINQLTGLSKDAAIAKFKAFYFSQFAAYNGQTAQNPTNLILQAPFTPTCRMAITFRFQATDPLVHSTLSDLVDLERGVSTDNVMPSAMMTNLLLNIGKLNSRYRPWGGNPSVGIPTPTDVSLAIKDPRVRSADDWDFPTGEPLSLSSIGRIHRGTPWQTIYLKSTNGVPLTSASLMEWRNWTGNLTSDLTNTIPIRDRELIDVLAPLLQSNDIRQLGSINSDAAQWRSTLDGLTVLTNASPEIPLIIVSNSPQVDVILSGIAVARAGEPGGYFRKLSQVLSVPELSCDSPYLNFGLNFSWFPSEEAMESIPSQLLSLLREDSTGTISISSNVAHLRFTVHEGYAYRIESSSDLVQWTSIATNLCEDREMEMAVPLTSDKPRYFRSALLP